jgi:lipoprotein-anchoring transpeptidase ErfK/SrfK
MTARLVVSLVAGAFILAGCVPEGVAPVEVPPPASKAQPVEPAAAPAPDPALVAMYAARPDGERALPAVDVTQFHRALLRNEVEYPTGEAPGTIVIDTKGPFLYLVEGEGRATRYGIAIGREGFGWKGAGTIARTAKWPRWTPPPEMIERDPSLAKWKDGQPGGVSNPLGARALYIYFGGRDSGFRIHGTNTPKSIGWAASSGCFRMLNQDVIDLYDRVPMGAKVVVI